jgi:hypothetical protein
MMAVVDADSRGAQPATSSWRLVPMFKVAEEVLDQMQRLTNQATTTTIFLAVCHPNVPRLDLIDLPGIRSDDQHAMLETKAIVEAHLNNASPHSVFLFKHRAIDVFSNNMAIDVLRRAGKLYQTVGVLTNCDKLISWLSMECQVVKSLTFGQTPDGAPPVGKGWVATASVHTAGSSIGAARDDYMRIRQYNKSEAQLFQEHVARFGPKELHGVNALLEKLVRAPRPDRAALWLNVPIVLHMLSAPLLTMRTILLHLPPCLFAPPATLFAACAVWCMIQQLMYKEAIHSGWKPHVLCLLHNAETANHEEIKALGNPRIPTADEVLAEMVLHITPPEKVKARTDAVIEYLSKRFEHAQVFDSSSSRNAHGDERAEVQVREYAEWENYALTEIEKLTKVITGAATEIADQAWACVLKSIAASHFKLDRFPKYLENCKQQLHGAVVIALFGDGRDDLGMRARLHTYATNIISPAVSRDITFAPSNATIHITAMKNTVVTMVLQGLPGVGSAKLRDLCAIACRDSAAEGVFREEACAKTRRALRARAAHLQAARETIGRFDCRFLPGHFEVGRSGSPAAAATARARSRDHFRRRDWSDDMQ